MRLTLKVACAALLTLLPFAAVGRGQGQAEERLSSLLDGRVTFTLPQAWAVRNHVSTRESGRAHLDVPNPAGDKAAAPAKAILTAKVVPAGIGVRHESDGVYENLYEGLAVLSDTFDGDDWRTMVWTLRDGGVPHLVLNRFGLTGRVSVELVVVFPSERADPKLFEQALADFNAMTASLKIDGRNEFARPVKAEDLSKRQAVSRRP
jgi:hypothetical protein